MQPLLRHVLSLVDTEQYSYSDLTSEINFKYRWIKPALAHLM